MKSDEFAKLKPILVAAETKIASLTIASLAGNGDDVKNLKKQLASAQKAKEDAKRRAAEIEDGLARR